MKKSLLGLALLISSSTFAALPLYTTADGANIMGCYGEDYESENTNRKYVIFRNTEDINTWWFFPANEGNVLALRGRTEPYSGGITGFDLRYEGEIALEDSPSEDWNVEAPSGTVFTARGNYAGFMMQDNMRAQFVKREYKTNDTVELECTEDIQVVKEWVRKVEDYSPM